ncbi:hypothetical protein Pdw03_1571 [Penicillium digitatum]|uniref:Uncharacterized protein n=3 Tax=Penicillium digitatum TaxID=36651 RepID=K9GD35_PEND2|nr:hypothetical protein PDIP_06370 [Penicillium digitatum Pd1]EKV12733.1 hypothetical protein PDIG_41690 [Penicillium digitatum PHI26]EKV21428.1 hypothetical protein PDIP_06370 [Penicillium digitatum Pd1]KAG0155409.1 hypothetical protein PDIDSM_986 [Penicillium digitatum]QQK46673.1 hypothetical protein Pdw03_1571 [Penicillium digitatum]
MLQHGLYRVLRIFWITFEFWFNANQSAFPKSQVRRSGKLSESTPLETLTISFGAPEHERSSLASSESKTWEKIYKEECLSFKARLEIQAQILRNDPARQGVDRMKNVRKELISLSHQAERIKEAAFEMIDETPDSVYVRNATPEWLSTCSGDPQLEQVCISMEYSLDRLAFELRSDPSMDLMVAGHLEQMTEDIEMDFL